MRNPLRLLKRAITSFKIRSRAFLNKSKYKILRRLKVKKIKGEMWVYGKGLMPQNSKNIEWSFHDERWDQIINRWCYRNRIMNGEKILLRDESQTFTSEVVLEDNGTIKINGKTKSNDEWIFLYLNKVKYNWVNYSFKFSIKFQTVFKEFQIDFRYSDFYNRYRYRFQDGYLYFDIIYKAEFIASLSSMRFPLEVNREYSFEVKVMGDIFQFWADGVLVSTDYGRDNIEKGAVAIILWEDDGLTDMKVEISSLMANELYIESF